MESTQDGSTASPEGIDSPPSGDETELVRAHRERAISLALQGRFHESEAWAREALRLRPDDVDAMNELGVAVWRQGREAEAEEIYRHARRLKPDDFRLLTNLGLALMAKGRPDEAADCFHEALRIEPGAFHARTNLGVVISNRGDFEGAMGPLVSALEHAPDSAEALQNLAMNLGRQGRWSEAIVYYDRAVRQRPDYPELHRNLGYALLAVGDFERGWPEHEWRLKCAPHPGCRINRTFWNGDVFPGQSILLHFEQGMGDTLQFIRYARLVKPRGGRVVVLCPPALVRLLSRCEGVDLAFDGLSFEPECHIQASLMSLPGIFGTTMETIPARVPYLSAEPALVEHWRSVLARLRVGREAAEAPARVHRANGVRGRPFLVGIAWQGRPEHAADHWRSFPLAQFAPLAEQPEARLISLQVGHGADQIAALGGRFPVLELPGRRGRDFSETAAIVSQLDLVIAPDSAVAHLAGGLGVPVWVGIPVAADWRWLAGRDDSPWYPTMRLFRQARLGDWEGVFRRMADQLAAVLGRKAAADQSEAA
jgi:Flp pilus assembly protein TadD